MARQLIGLNEVVEMIQNDSASGSEPNISDNDENFDYIVPYIGIKMFWRWKSRWMIWTLVLMYYDITMAN